MREREGRRGRATGLPVVAGVLLVATLAAIVTAGVAAASPTEGGVEVGDEAPVTANDLREPQAHNSPTLAVDPTDSRFVALAERIDDPEFSCGLQLSGDGGRSWVDGEPLVALPDGVDHCYAPQVAFDADGTLYYLFVGLSGEGNTPAGVWLTSSQDRGQSFARPWQVLDEFNYQVRLAIDRQAGEAGRLHLVWLTTGEGPTVGGLPAVHNPIVAAHSDDGGRTFTEPVEVSGSQQRLVVAPQVAIGDEGEVHVAYYDLEDDVRDYQGLDGPVWPDPWAVEVATSTDGGATFPDRVVVDDEVQPPERVMVIFTMPPPSIATGSEGRVYTAWHDARNGDWDAFVAASSDRARSWTEPVSVADAEPGSTRQLLPQVGVAPDGRVEVVYFDRGDDAHLQHVAYAASHDQGRSFEEHRRLTAEPSDARSGPQLHLRTAQGRAELGAGLALHAGDATALAAWPDTRFAVPGTAQQDLYRTTVARDAGGASLAAWPVVGVSAVAAAAIVGAVLVVWRRRRRPDVAALVLLLLVVAGPAGCGPGRADEAPLPDAPATVEVGLDEYAFDVPETVPPGRTVFQVTNHGDEAHELVLLRLPDEAGQLGELLGSSTPRALPPTYVVPAREPGQSGEFVVELEPGRYGLVCFLEDADGVRHDQHGMFAEFEVSG